MPDFGLTEALAGALKAAGKVEVMHPAEAKLAANAAKLSPGAAAPVVPEAAPGSPTAPGAVLTASPAGGDARAPSALPTSAQGPAAAATDISQPPAAPGPGAASEAVQAPGGAVPGSEVTNAQTPPSAGAAAAVTPTPVSTTPEPGMRPVKSPTPLPPGARITDVDPITGVATVRLPDGTNHVLTRPLSTEEQAQRLVQADIGNFDGRLNTTHMPNLDMLQAPEKLKASILQVAEDNAGAIEARRRNVIKDAEMVDLAHNYNVTHDVATEVMERQVGLNPKSPEQMGAALMVGDYQSAELLNHAMELLSKSEWSPEDWIKLQDLMNRQMQFQPQLAGMKAEGARTVRVMGLQRQLPFEVQQHMADLIKQSMEANGDPRTLVKAIALAGKPNGINAIVNGWMQMPMLQRLGAAAVNVLSRVFVQGMLSGGNTLIRIFGGNTFNLAKNQYDLFLGGLANGTRRLAAHNGNYLSAEDGITLQDAWAHMHGVMTGFSDAWRVAGKAWRSSTNLDSIARASEASDRVTGAKLTDMFADQDTPWIQSLLHGLDVALDFPGRVIGSIDAFGQHLPRRGYTTMMAMKQARIAALEGKLDPNQIEAEVVKQMTNPDPGLAQAADAWGHRITFQTPFYMNPDGTPGGMQRFSSLIANVPALRIIFPFMRTAYNIAAQGTFETLPLVNMVSARTRAALQAGGVEASLAHARVASGVSFMALAAWAATHDMITGAYPKDPKERGLWTAEGRKPYSFRVGDTWYSYASLEPVATTIGITADVVRLMTYIHQLGQDNTLESHEQQVQDIIYHVAASAIENFGQKGYMQGAGNFAEMYTDPQRFAKDYIENTAAGFQPYSGFTRMLRNMDDPYLRTAHGLTEKLENQLPLLSKNLPARPDWFGDVRETATGDGLFGPLSPLPAGHAKNDPVLEEIKDVMDKTQTVPIAMPPGRLALLGGDKGIQGGSGYTLTPDEYAEYVNWARHEPLPNGSTYHELLEKLINSIGYQRAQPAERSVLIENLTHEVDKAGAARMYQNNPDFRDNLRDWKERDMKIAHGK